jgi:hypothetical protein
MAFNALFQALAQQQNAAAPVAPTQQPWQQPAAFTPSSTPWQQQIGNAIDYSSSSGGAWDAIGRDGVISYIGDSLNKAYGTNDLSQFRYVEDAGAPGGYRLQWGGMQAPTGLTGALRQGALSTGLLMGAPSGNGSDGSSMTAGNAADALGFGATWEGEGGTGFNFYRKPDGSVGIKTGGLQSNETGDIIAALAILGGGYMAGTGALGGAAAGGAGAAEGAAAAGAAEGAAAGAAGSSTAAMGAGAADIGMAGFGQFGIPSAIPAGAGYGSLGATALSAPVSTFGGAAIGGGMAGTLAGMGAGMTDLGGGLYMGADGSITGATGLNPSNLSNAGIMDSVGYGGAGTATMGAGGGGSGGSTPGTFNAAADSQAANAAIDAGGGNALSGYQTASGGTSLFDSLASKVGNMGMKDWLGLASTVGGAISGGQGQEGSSSSTRSMDPRMDSLFYGDLAPKTQGLLNSTVPQAQLAGAQLMSKGSGLLGQTAPNTATNPYLSGVADDMQRRTADLLGQNNQAIRGNFVGSGGLGGSRQGVAEGVAAGKAADYLQGNLANLYGNAYNQDQSRLRQDWTLGSGMLGQGVNLPFLPAQNTAQIYQPFTGAGTTTNNTQSGGGWGGALGGALAGASFGRSMNWW